jgi:hypothetical protein
MIEPARGLTATRLAFILQRNKNACFPSGL